MARNRPINIRSPSVSRSAKSAGEERASAGTGRHAHLGVTRRMASQLDSESIVAIAGKLRRTVTMQAIRWGASLSFLVLWMMLCTPGVQAAETRPAQQKVHLPLRKAPPP